MNPAILHSDVQAFIEANLNTDTTRILLSKSPFSNVTSGELAEQIDSKKRCEKKLPIWFSTPGIYYPPKISIEQASSEVTAKFKATLVKGKTLLDLTGGFGVDSYYFAKAGMQVWHAELNSELSAIAHHNAKILDVPAITFYQGNGLELLQKGQFFDTIFIDPSRRVNRQKVFQLKDCEPNIPQHLELLLKACSCLIIKTSPLLDLQAGLKELTNVKRIYIVSVKNDCKELLWILEPGNNSFEPEVICHTFGDEDHDYRFRASEERSLMLKEFSEPLKFLYEPDVALLKAGAFKLISKDFNILKLHTNSHLYTSVTLNAEFPGRKFMVEKWGDYKSFMKQNKLKQANVITRNFPLSPSEVKSRHHIADGSEQFLIFTTGPLGQLLAIQAQKVEKQKRAP